MPVPLPIHPISLPTPWPPVGEIHTYLVRQDPLTLVDTGCLWADSRELLRDGLRAHGVEMRQIRRLLITHAHMDHCGLAGWIQEESGAEVWLHPDEAGKLETPDWWLAARDRVMAESGTPVDLAQAMHETWLQGRALLTPLGSWRPIEADQHFGFDGGELQAVHLPGHALGHTGFLDPTGQVLLGGDHLLESITPNPIMEPVRPAHPGAVAHAPFRALTLGMFLAALERVMQMEVRRVLPGHGTEIADHVAVARGYMQRHERRLESLLAMLAAAGSTAFDLTRRVYPNVTGMNSFLALSEVLAHLDLLAVRGRVLPHAEDGAVVYRSLA